MNGELIINILFYILGIGLPTIIIFIGICKKKFILNIIIAVIIFLIFYIVKLGGISLLNDNNKLEEPVNFQVETTLKTTTTVTTTKNRIEVIDGVTYIDGVLIVNKSYPLPSDFVPKNTYKEAGSSRYCSECLDIDAYNNFKTMKADALSLGLNIWIQSGYRSYALQNDLYNNYVSRDGKEMADTYSARPGHSEHQTGLAFDLNTITDDFQYTNEGVWVNENAYKYGFIIRYPKGKEHITGYKYESWHLRYVGKELAETLYNNGEWITLEEYFKISSTYSD